MTAKLDPSGIVATIALRRGPESVDEHAALAAISRSVSGFAVARTIEWVREA